MWEGVQEPKRLAYSSRENGMRENGKAVATLRFYIW